MACSGTSDHGTHRGPAKSQGGGGPYVLTLLEHSYCMLEGQLKVVLYQKKGGGAN